MLYKALILFFLLEYLRPGNFLPLINLLKINTLVPILIFIFSVVKRNNISNSDILKDANSKFFMIFLLMIILSVLTAEVTFYSYTIFKAVFGYFLIFIIILKLVDNIRKIKLLFVTFISIHILLAIINPEVILNPAERSSLNFTAPFLGDGNDFALSIVITMPFCLFLYLTSPNKKSKLFLILLFSIFLFCVVGTSSRGGTMAIAMVFLYLWSKSKNKVLGLLTLLLVVIAVAMFAPSSYFQRLQTIKNYESEGSAQGRIMAWKSAVRMANDHPVLGVGAGHFAVKYGVDYRPKGYGRTDLPWHTAHSIYFLALGEFGYTGLIFLVSLILYNFIKNEATINDIERSESADSLQRYLFISLNSSLIGFAVGGAFLSALYYPHIFVLSGLMSVCRNNYLKK
jgi:probable O-glycosylation ligase (exosortase A-associated)